MYNYSEDEIDELMCEKEDLEVELLELAKLANAYRVQEILNRLQEIGEELS
jgi:hypothetical protein